MQAYKIALGMMALAGALLASCASNAQKDGSEQAVADPVEANNPADEAIVFTVDGMTRTISASEREVDTINFAEHPIKTLFRKRGDRQFEMNLNFYEKDIADQVPITYTLPDDHPGNVVKVDLNFMDFEREVERSLNKRLIFAKGTITIHELSPDRIRFEFDGEVHELPNVDHRSPVSGSVDVRY